MKKAAISFCLSMLVLVLYFGFALSVEPFDAFSPKSSGNANFLEGALEHIMESVDRSDDAGPSNPTDHVWGEEESVSIYSGSEPSNGVSSHLGAGQAMAVNSGDRRLKRSTEKASPKGGKDFKSTSLSRNNSDDWRKVSFSSGLFTPGSGLDNEMVSEVLSLKAIGRKFVYGFILMDEYLSKETRQEIQGLGVSLLGPHSNLYKAKFPLDMNILEGLVSLSYVVWAGYSLSEQKLDIGLQETVDHSSSVETIPIIINLFDEDPQGTFKLKLKSIGATVGKYDPGLLSYRALASRSTIEKMAFLDFVLFVEPIREAGPGHDESMPMIGADYIRSGAAGSTYDGSPIPLGIMDTGFWIGSGGHRDLNKFGCGINFTDEATDVWVDEGNHGTHVLGTVCGTGTANDRYRGIAMGIGESVRIRAAKVWGGTNSNYETWMLDAMDFFDDYSACGGSSPRPMIINISGGTHGAYLRGTDSLSRKLDEKVWNYKQLYVPIAGNEVHPGRIRSPGVAKNALTVGGIDDKGEMLGGNYSPPGAKYYSGSEGPTGDGRMKPNVVAPGTSITAPSTSSDGSYDNQDGTSFAAPHVTGLAATLMHHYPEFRWRPYLLRAHLMATAILHQDNYIPSSNHSGGRSFFGLGKVSSYISHWGRSGSGGWSIQWVWDTVNSSKWAYFDILVPEGAQRLVIVMTWDEPPASAGAEKAVMYDLDLWADYNRDQADKQGQGGEYSSQSSVDNVEYLIINDPAAGSYRVKAANWDTPEYDLPFAFGIMINQGDPTPAMDLTVNPTAIDLAVGSSATIRTTVTNPSYVASGVGLILRETAPVLESVIGCETTRKDGITMYFGTHRMVTLGDIMAGDSRSVDWTLRANYVGTKTLTFEAESENGGEVIRTVTMTAGTPVSITYPSLDCDSNFFVSWSSVNGATSYTLERATNTSFTDAVTVHTGAFPSYNQTGLGNGTFYYRVRADSSYGSSGWRNGGAVRISSPPAMPTSITYPSLDCDSNFFVSWSSVNGATSYTLERATNTSFTDAVTVHTGALPSYNQTGIGSGTFYYRVRANNSCGSGSWKIGGAMVVSSPPAMPTSITYPSLDCDGSFTVGWSSLSGATSYTLQRTTNSSFAGAVTVYTGASISYSQTGLGNGTYYYRVRANNSCGSSGWRNGGATVANSLPTMPSSINYPSSDTDGSFTVGWVSVSGATNYTLQRAMNSSFTSAVTVYSGASFSYVQTGLSDGTYYYRVRANNNCGSSGWRDGGAIVVIRDSNAPSFLPAILLLLLGD